MIFMEEDNITDFMITMIIMAEDNIITMIAPEDSIL